MLSSAERWIVALPRTALIDEQAAALSKNVLQGRLPAVVKAIHSDQPGKKGNVGRRVQDTLRDHAASEHAIILLTHEALLDLDPLLLRGWGVQVDEIPESGVLSGWFAAGIGWSTLAGLYRLVPVSDASSWCRVEPRDDVDLPTLGEVFNDPSKTLVAFHKAVRSRERTVYVDVASWEDAKKKVRWYSCWTPAALLEHASSVTFAGAGVFDSLMYHAAQQTSAGSIKFEPIDIGAQNPRTAQPTVVIYYYTRHLGGTTWWQTDEGSRCLVAISRHLEAIKFKGYWSGNDVVRPYFRHRFPPALECQPKVAGTNSLRHHTQCAFFYSNKSQAADDAVLEVLGLDCDAIRRAREDEDIVQFFFRGAVREGAFGGTYEVHLYSLDQAERLKEYLRSEGITDDVRLIGVDAAGIMEVQRPEAKVSSQPTQANSLTTQQRAERKKAQARERSQRGRDEEKAAKMANGTARPRGRPRKVTKVTNGAAQPRGCPKKAA
jgi:hypothetical protein